MKKWKTWLGAFLGASMPGIALAEPAAAAAGNSLLPLAAGLAVGIAAFGGQNFLGGYQRRRQANRGWQQPQRPGHGACLRDGGGTGDSGRHC